MCVPVCVCMCVCVTVFVCVLCVDSQFSYSCVSVVCRLLDMYMPNANKVCCLLIRDLSLVYWQWKHRCIVSILCSIRGCHFLTIIMFCLAVVNFEMTTLLYRVTVMVGLLL